MHFKALCSVPALPLLKRGLLTKTVTACKNNEAVKKIWMIMRVTAFLLLMVAQSAMSAGGFAQRITLSEKNAPLKKVFAEIKKQTGYTFIYPEDLLQTAKPVDVEIKNGTLEQVLNLCFNNQPLLYTIIQQTIIVKEKEAPRKTAEGVDIPPAEIKGMVTSENGPVAGANVVIKRTGKGTSTAANGQFSLPEVNEDDILVVSYIGYQTQEVPLKDKKGFVHVQLKVAVDKLDEIQVLAYGGATTRRISTGAVTKVTSEEISRNPVVNVLQALAGRTTGMSISQMNGLTGGDVFFQVRGQNSLTANNYTSAPLVIIDGMPYPNTPISLSDITGVTNNVAATGSPNGYGSPLYNINPRDIESVEILKDADATAIYGSRAANGVMLITTKKGKQGKTKFDVNAYTGVALNTRRVDLLTTPEYLALRREAFKNAGITPSATNAIDLFKWDTTRNTDWQDELLGHTAQTTDATVTMSGGAGGTSFLVSGNYHHENTIYPDRRGSSKAGAHVSLNHTSVSGKFNIGLSGMVNTTNTKFPSGSYGADAYAVPPHWQPYDTAGNFNWEWDWGRNPFASMKTAYFNKSFSLTSNLQLRYTILPGFDAKASIGYTRLQNDQQLIYPKAAVSPSITYFQAYNMLNTSLNQTLNVEPQLQYTGNIGKGKLNVLAGSTIMKTIAEMPFQVSALGFASDAYINNIALASTYSVSTGYNAYQYASFFGRANYNWDNKYIVNGTFRRDGSSRFGANRRFGNFGAIGAAWLFSNEGFARHLSVLSFGKLRGSMGWVGSDNVPNYKFFSTYTPTSQYAGSALRPSQLENPEFGWESTSKLEGALELGFLKDRVLVSASWYRNRTGNQLVDYPVSTQSGFPSYTANLSSAVVQNTGWEFELNTINVQTQHFKWTTSINLTLPQNKLLQFDGIEKTSYAGSLVVGKPLNSIYAVPFTGVDSAGKPTFADPNKNGVVDKGLAVYGKGDRSYIGKDFATAFGGLSNSITWKNLQLDFLFQYTVGLKKQNFLGASGSAPPGTFANVTRKAVETYRSLGLDKAFIRPAYSDDWFYYTYYSDATYMDASFIRLTNMSLSYNLPGNAMKKMHLAGGRVYLQAQNLFVISNYDGYDPESGPVAVPPLLRVVGGIQCSF